MRKKCSKKIKKAKSNHHKKVLIDNINKPNKFWSQINVFLGKSQSMANVSTDKRPSLNILSCFYSTMASKLKKSIYVLQILPGVILQNFHQKLWKLLDFHIFQNYLYKKSYNSYLARNPQVLTIGYWKTVVASYQNRCFT